MTWRNNDRLLSQPIRLFWNGWESNTMKLQERGWELSVQQDIERQEMSIAMRHQQSGMRGLTQSTNWDYWAQMERHRFVDPRSLGVFNCQIASDISINCMATHAMDIPFEPIDAKPMYGQMEITSKPLDEIAHFRKIEKPSDEIFLRKASMAQIMAMALEKQEPRQEQIRREMVRQNEIEVMRNSKLRANLRLVG